MEQRYAMKRFTVRRFGLASKCWPRLGKSLVSLVVAYGMALHPQFAIASDGKLAQAGTSMAAVTITTSSTTSSTTPSAAQEPVLEVSTGATTVQLSRSHLLAKAKDIKLDYDSAYGRPMRYRAVAFSEVLPKSEQYDSVQFVASDGFVANIPGKDLAGAGQPYLAIEEAELAWPAIDSNNPHKTTSAGPFYLVWLTPTAGKISNEQWPYQVAKIRVERSLLSRFPQLVPPAPGKLTPQHAQVLRGLQVFVKNCAVCHKLDGAGDGEIGPDLNQPYNPTQYFQESFLRKLIRQPSAVRTWKTSLMPGFDEKSISSQELDDLISYLKAMANSRRKAQ